MSITYKIFLKKMGNTESFDSVFYITMTGLGITLIVALVNTCLKSKCKKCTVGWNFLIVERDVKAEIQQEHHEVDMNLNPYDVTRVI
jgi:hypothetical protein